MLAVFDFEGTLTENEFWDQFPETLGTTASAMFGEKSFAEVTQERFQKIAGKNEEEFTAAANNLTLRPNVKRLFDALHEQGVTTAIVSGGFDFFVGKAAHRLNAAHWKANSVDFHDGKVNGIKGKLLDAKAKAEIVKQLQQEFNLTQMETVVVGDGANDLEMMQYAGLRIGFNAKPVVQEKASLMVDGNDAFALLEPMLEHKHSVEGKPKVLIAGKVSRPEFDEARINAAFYDALSYAQLLEKIPGYDVLVYRGSEKIDEPLLRAGKRLKMVVRPGVGLDHIDLQAAERLGIRVSNTPGASTESVAEYTLCLMLSLLRKIPQAHASTKKGEWRKNEFHGLELNGKTVGIVGLGRIGKSVAQKLQCFNAKVVAYDPYLNDREFATRNVTRKNTLEQLLVVSDVITIHTPLTEETKHLLNSSNLHFVKRGAYVINAARGEVVEQDALVDALKTGVLSGAALDVYVKEPLEKSELHELNNVLLLPHLGGSTLEATKRIAADIARQVNELELAAMVVV